MTLKAPHNLNLDTWWQSANCKGLKIKQVTPEVCAGCDVYKECIWTAMTDDDRVDYGMFIRETGFGMHLSTGQIDYRLFMQRVMRLRE